MRTKKLIKQFRFEDKNRSKIELGPDVRLNADRHYLQLVADAQGKYPTSDNLYAKTWVTDPSSVKGWANFQADVFNPRVDGVELTSVSYRLNDGTDDYYWDGGAWSAPGANDWSSEADVANNITSFSSASKELQVIVNLKTTDSGYTPIVRSVKVLFDSDVEFQEDIIYRSLIRSLRQEVRPIADYPFAVSGDSTTLDLANDYPLSTPYNVVDVDAVFNDTDDPDHLVDLLDSYNPSTMVITLTTQIDDGEKAWVRFIWEPEVAVATSRDYDELDKVPQIILDTIELVDAYEIPPFDSVLNKDSGQGTKVPAPIMGDLEITLDCITNKQTDQMRLADNIKAYFINNKVLKSTGLDEEYRLWLIDEYELVSTTSGGDIYVGRVRFRIVDVLFLVGEAVTAYAVLRLNLTGDMDAVIGT